MGSYRVVVTDHDFKDLDIERSILTDIATVVDLTEMRNELDSTEFKEKLRQADALLNFRRPITSDHEQVLTDCKIISRYGIGVDNIDLEMATRQNIPVTNVPEYCIEEVATHTLSLGLALVRGLKPYDRSVSEGQWTRDRGPEIHRLSTMTIGVVGYGSIGRAVADRFLPFGCDVVASDPYVDERDVNADVSLVPFDSLVEQADVLTVHSPLTDSTRGLLDAEVFERLSNQAYLINTSRGQIVELEDLTAALDAGELLGAGLDVFPQEPPDVDNPLRDHPSVITTPHVSWYSEEANTERRELAAENVRRVLGGNPPRNVVNDLPEENRSGR